MGPNPFKLFSQEITSRSFFGCVQWATDTQLKRLNASKVLLSTSEQALVQFSGPIHSKLLRWSRDLQWRAGNPSTGTAVRNQSECSSRALCGKLHLEEGQTSKCSVSISIKSMTQFINDFMTSEQRLLLKKTLLGIRNLLNWTAQGSKGHCIDLGLHR